MKPNNVVANEVTTERHESQHGTADALTHTEYAVLMMTPQRLLNMLEAILALLIRQVCILVNNESQPTLPVSVRSAGSFVNVLKIRMSSLCPPFSHDCDAHGDWGTEQLRARPGHTEKPSVRNPFGVLRPSDSCAG